jgi:hypothetical protein
LGQLKNSVVHMSLAIPQNMQTIPTGSSRYPALELTTSYSDFIKPADGLMASRLDGVRLAAQSGLKSDVAPCPKVPQAAVARGAKMSASLDALVI